MTNPKKHARHSTLIDVAREAGVSRATASLVLRGTGRVSQPTRERVFAAMDRLGYIYNRGAAALRTRESKVVGILVTTVTNPFFAEVIVGLEQRLGELGYVSFLANTLNDVDRQSQLITFLQENNVAGIVMVPAFSTPPELLEPISQRGTPLLFLTRKVGNEPQLYIGTDDVAGGKIAADHLFQHGCRKVVYIGGPEEAVARRDRIAGFQASATEHGIPLESLTYIASPTNSRGGLNAGRSLIASRISFDGLICHSDSVAFGVYRALHDSGKADSARVVSFDNIENSEMFEPPLTTVSASPQQLGRLAAQTLYNNLSADVSPPTSTALVKPELIIRHSCGC